MLGGVIRGKLVTLRIPTEADLPAFNAWMADPRVRRGARAWHEPAMLATWKERLAEEAKDRRHVLWSIDEGELLVGLWRVQLQTEPEGGFTDTGFIVLDPAAHGRGLGFDAALALHRYLFDYLNLTVGATELPADNVPALRLLERLGYARYALGHAVYYRDGAYVDQLRMRMDRETWDARWRASEREYAPHPPGAEL